MCERKRRFLGLMLPPFADRNLFKLLVSCIASMGRIKTQLIKRLTMDVIKDSKERCTTQFEDNKKVVAELLGDASKKMRNSVAGYVTRLMKVKEEY